MTASLMGRLFVVPAIIVCVLLGVAVVVVLFGTTTVDKPETVSALLDKIEAGSGDRTMGLLFTDAKETWQAAQELASRFKEKSRYVPENEIAPAAARIARMLDRFPPGQDVDTPAPLQQHFLMMALARLETPAALPILTRYLADPNWQTRRTAVQALAEMRSVPETRTVIPLLVDRLADRNKAVQIVACVAIAAVAPRGDAKAIAALKDRLESDREVQWNVAMSLARLGDGGGRLMLMNMLDRAYWERLDLEYEQDGSAVRRRFSPAEIDNNLKAAIEAACCLADQELRDLVLKLRSDPSVKVRAAVGAALARSAPESALHRPVTLKPPSEAFGRPAVASGIPAGLLVGSALS